MHTTTSHKVFSWIPIHKEIANFLYDKEYRQSDLIDILNKVLGKTIMDKDDASLSYENIKLNEIDPFTFLTRIYAQNKLDSIKSLKMLLDIIGIDDKVYDLKGIPFYHQKSPWNFPYKFRRIKEHIPFLWRLFRAVAFKEEEITEELYQKALSLEKVQQAKLSKMLYLYDSHKYIPINKSLINYLKESKGIVIKESERATLQGYKSAINRIKKAFPDKENYEIYYAAEIYNKPLLKDMQPRFWLFQIDSKHYNFRYAYKKTPTLFISIDEHTSSIKKGDKVLLWNTGTNSGCCGTAEIISDVLEDTTFPDDFFTERDLRDTKTNRYVEIKLLTNLFDNPLLKTEITNYNSFNYIPTNQSETNFLISQDSFEYIENIIKNREKTPRFPKNTILYGPPGTGKTYHTIDRAACIIKKVDSIEYEEARSFIQEEKKDRKDHSRVAFVTFHQNYSYEDFIIGLRPNVQCQDLQFTYIDGIFKKICNHAKEDPTNNYVLIIDEINRANISGVFGELITLIEDDKRLGKENEITVSLPNGELFGVPDNLYIIGTMNTADKSIALLDIALRRRFTFEALYPDSSLISDSLKKEVLEKLNSKNSEEKGADYQIGHAFFMNNTNLIDIMNQKVIPLLMEYYMNDVEAVINLIKDAGLQLKKGYPIQIC